MNRHRWLLICPFVLVLTTGCYDKSVENVSPRYVLAVTALPAAGEDIRLAGVVRAHVESDLSFQVLGRVVSRFVEVGDEVKAGQVLARLDPLALQFSVQNAKASLQDAQAKLKNAVLTESRQYKLAMVKATSAEALELSEQNTIAARAAVEEAQARLRKANEQLSYVELKAQFNGIVTSVSLEVGQTVTPGQAMFQLAHLNQRDVVVDMPEVQLQGLNLGQRFKVISQMKSSVMCEGELIEIAPAADAATRLRRVKIAINNAPNEFRIGSFVSAIAFNSNKRSHLLVVPATAILTLKQQNFVWVINTNNLTVSKRMIQVVSSLQGSETVQVLSGLQEGEQIVIAGVHSLQAGQKIRIERKLTL